MDLVSKMEIFQMFKFIFSHNNIASALRQVQLFATHHVHFSNIDITTWFLHFFTVSKEFRCTYVYISFWYIFWFLHILICSTRVNSGNSYFGSNAKEKSKRKVEIGIYEGWRSKIGSGCFPLSIPLLCFWLFLRLRQPTQEMHTSKIWRHGKTEVEFIWVMCGEKGVSYFCV